MVPVVVLLVSWLAMRGVGALGVGAFASWQSDAAYALALMFLFTASAHFNKTRHDLARMIPRQFPFPEWIIVITGICEILGALGLIIPATRYIAGVGLVLLLSAMLPANISAALRDIPLRGRPATPLWLRVPIQIIFVGMTLWVTLGALSTPGSLPIHG
jgi:uncharacterized membrane protein